MLDKGVVMKNFKLFALLAALFGLNIACGGNPNAPSTDAPKPERSAILTLNGAPGGTATVVVAGVSYSAPTSGGRLELPASAIGAKAVITAAGHLDRTIVVSSGTQDVALFSLDGKDADYYRYLLYKSAYDESLYPLMRIKKGMLVSIVLEGDGMGDSSVRDAFSYGIGEMNRLTGITGVSYALSADGASPTGVVVFRAYVDPSDSYLIGGAMAVTYRDLDSAGYIRGGKIVYRTSRAAGLPSLVAHELGHTLGLWHSREQGDLMRGGSKLSIHEEHAVREMYRRFPGNIWVDDSTQVRASSAGRSMVIVG